MRHTIQLGLAVAALCSTVAMISDAQVGRRDASGIRVAVAAATGAMSGDFRGSESHLFENFGRVDAGPAIGAQVTFDWRNVGAILEAGATGHHFGPTQEAASVLLRIGLRYQPGFTLAGFTPGIEVSRFGMALMTDMQDSEVPPTVGIAVPSCCYDDDLDPNQAQEGIWGTGLALSVERSMGRGFSFLARYGWDRGRVTSQHRGENSYPMAGKPRFEAQRFSIGLQFAFWPLP